MKYAIFEIVEQIADAWGPKYKQLKADEHRSPQLAKFMDLIHNRNIEWIVDPNIEYTPNNGNMNTLRTKLFQEMDQLYHYTNMTSYPNLPQEKRNKLWRTTLEVLHPKDAELLVNAIRNRHLWDYRLSFEHVKELFPEVSYKWPQPEKSRIRKKDSQQNDESSEKEE